MRMAEKLKIIETYGGCVIDSRSRSLSETVRLYEYEISVHGKQGAIYRTGDTYSNAIDRMYLYLKSLMRDSIT